MKTDVDNMNVLCRPMAWIWSLTSLFVLSSHSQASILQQESIPILVANLSEAAQELRTAMNDLG